MRVVLPQRSVSAAFLESSLLEQSMLWVEKTCRQGNKETFLNCPRDYSQMHLVPGFIRVIIVT